MDGTVYLGETWIDGAMDFLWRIHDAGKEYVFLTNNSSRSPMDYVAKLDRMGLKTDRSSIISSSDAAIWYLKQHYPSKKVYLMGNETLCREFLSEGIELSDTDPDLVVVGFDTSLTYEKLCLVCRFVRGGLPYIATHPDINCPTENGMIPDAGSFIALIEASTGRRPDIIIGKPYRTMTDYLLGRGEKLLGSRLEAAEVAMIGDRLYTDIAAGNMAGFTSILVLSGESSMEDLAASVHQPDLVFDSVADISF
ncbi:MAG: HAD-IIA family hydrolase [Lachnospiraceae bacterium]|nr:HAD-IIA family hydrolase [Lachnospiraceae bacterium]